MWRETFASFEEVSWSLLGYKKIIGVYLFYLWEYHRMFEMLVNTCLCMYQKGSL